MTVPDQNDVTQIGTNEIMHGVEAGGQERESRRRLIQRPRFLVGAIVCVLFALMAVLSSLVAPYDPSEVFVGPPLAPPSLDHLMGTDSFGRDVFSRVVYGSRLSLFMGVGAVLVASIVGTTLGTLAGYLHGRWLDSLLMRWTDILLAFPGLLLALTVVAVMGPGYASVITAVGIGGVPHIARVVRSAVISVCEQDYMLAARTNGCSDVRIIRKYVLPNVGGEIIVMSTLYLAFSVLIAASLSFLGVGVPPPTAEWGGMVSDGRSVLAVAWWVSAFPGSMIMLFVISVNLIGDALGDVLDRTRVSP